MTTEAREIAKGYMQAILACNEFETEEFAIEAIYKIQLVCTDAAAMLEELGDVSYVGGEKEEYIDLECFGHDLWYTSQGHGTGFWDSNRWEVNGEPDTTILCALCEKAHYGVNMDAYLGDDGLIYL